MRKVFEVITDTIIDETKAENCLLVLLNRETGDFTVKAAEDSATQKAVFIRPPAEQVPPSELAKVCCRMGCPTWGAHFYS